MDLSLSMVDQILCKEVTTQLYRVEITPFKSSIIYLSLSKFSFCIFNLTIDLNDFKGAKVFSPVFALNEVESLICVDNGMDSNFGRFNIINKEFPGDYQI